MIHREKLMVQVNVRITDAMTSEIDLYVEERARQARLPLSRAQAVREILAAWEVARRAGRMCERPHERRSLP